jgi:hypothetical protein
MPTSRSETVRRSANCRAGCPTQDHEAYAECLRSAGLRVAYSNSASNQDYTSQRKWDRELSRYRDLTASGVEPAGTTHRDMDKAEKEANG